MITQTRGVLAAARKSTKGNDLTHVVNINAQGKVTVLCKRVKPEHLADDCAEDVNSIPTCPVCLNKDFRQPMNTSLGRMLNNALRK